MICCYNSHSSYRLLYTFQIDLLKKYKLYISYIAIQITEEKHGEADVVDNKKEYRIEMQLCLKLY